MKKFLIGLLAVGLIMTISMPAMAVDVKFSGMAEIAGYWESNRTFASSNEQAARFYTSFIRLEPVFQVADGLKLVTRFEGLERVAGLQQIGSESANGSRNNANEQNFALKRAYLDANILGGNWWIGYQQGGRWGTDFINKSTDVFRVRANYYFGPWTILALQEKGEEDSVANNETLTTRTFSESEYDAYALAAIYKWSSGEAGYLQYYIVDNRHEQDATTPYRAAWWYSSPYFKATFGPLYTEGQIFYAFGKKQDYLTPSTAYSSINFNSFSWYLKAKYTMGPAFVGAQVATVAGDDPSTTDKFEGNPFAAAGAKQGQGDVWQPCLIMWNDWMGRFNTTVPGSTNSATSQDFNGGMPYNVKLYQVFGGYTPLPKLAVNASFSMLWAEQKPLGYTSDKYGNEFDISATYKLYDNLAYTLAYGYLWVGDYFKAGSDANQVGNDWLLMHKLTLTF